MCELTKMNARKLLEHYYQKLRFLQLKRVGKFLSQVACRLLPPRRPLRCVSNDERRFRAGSEVA